MASTYTIFDQRKDGGPAEAVVADGVKNPIRWLAKNADPKLSAYTSIDATYAFTKRGRPYIFSASYKVNRKEVYFVLCEPNTVS